MTRPRQNLVRELVDDLQPVRHPGRILHAVALWLATSWVYTVLVVSATGSWRPGFADQLAGSPQFLGEGILGLASGIALAAGALRLGIPDPDGPLKPMALPLCLAALWSLAYVVGFWHPALEPSMLGKREHCWWETLLFAMPPLLCGLFLLRRLLPLQPAASGAMMGLAAGALPALAMQLACMYEPSHALTHHLAPALGVAAVGAILAPLLLRERARASV